MSDKVFLDIVNMSITGSFAILIIMLARLLLKKAPKVFSYALWFVAFFRLLVPVSFESVLSILPFNTTPLSTDMLYIETPYVETGIKAIDSVINPVVATEVFDSTANVYQIFTFWGKIIWFIGVCAFCLYSIRSYSKLKKKLQSAVLLRDNIYISQVVGTPFALGLRNPKIYLPSNLADAQEYVIAHEQTHLARRDNLAKILGYVVLILHWFNPLVWLAFKLFVTDMEMSCDESVIRNSKEDIRKEYSRSLLELSIEKSTLGIPMAFAEGNPKERIKNVMKSNTKKIIGFAGLGAVILIVVIAICLIPNRPQYATAKQTITEINAIATPSATHAEIKTADGNKTITDSAYFNELLTLDGDAELRLAIMSSIAQEESRKTSERVKWGQKRQMEQGVVFGRSMLGYDVEGGKMTINEEGAKVVRLIFHKFVNEGKGTHVIARELREEGISPMRVKEWSNTVILRVIRNEKYCGDLVQKKTYTPDFLSHEKKYNRGQEEFVIIKDHHEPIISRELFDEANRILDAKSLSQEGKAKHSNRYPFSGKIKCGCCGSSYVARYKTRKDGSRYKAWRCNEAAKHGSPHIDKAGNQVGCTGLSIRNEDATHIMYLVTRSLKYNRNKIINNLTAVIQSIIAMDTTGTDVLKLQEQIKKIEGKRANLIDLYMSNLINKDEFTATRASCDAEIEELQSIIESVDKQREMIEQQQQLLKEIEDAIKEIVSGVEYEDEFYKHILDKMVVQDKDNIDVYLNLLPMKWSYTVAKASKKAVASEWNISEASLPMSVSRAFSSG